jgi:glutamate 5-kinase
MKQPTIIKIGSHVVVDCIKGDQQNVQCSAIQQLLQVAQTIQQSGQPVVLVVSGAVGTGRLHGTVERKQALASRGQFLLTTAIAQFCPPSLPLSLLLLSREDIVNRRRYLSLQETFSALFAAGIVPIVNENDATGMTGKTDFPDNDHLAAILAITTNAERLFLLTDVDGVYDNNPKEPGAKLYTEIANVNLELLKAMGGTGSSLSRGGMLGKLKAARLATSAGISTHIINGYFPERITRVLAGESIGTHCKPRTHESVELTNRDRWLMSAKGSEGTIQLDQGASAAVQKRKSLLAVGVHSVYGNFAKGDSVEIIDYNKETIAIGLVSQTSEELQTLLKQDAKPYGVEVVHADNLILI